MDVMHENLGSGHLTCTGARDKPRYVPISFGFSQSRNRSRAKGQLRFQTVKLKKKFKNNELPTLALS